YSAGLEILPVHREEPRNYRAILRIAEILRPPDLRPSSVPPGRLILAFCVLLRRKLLGLLGGNRLFLVGFLIQRVQLIAEFVKIPLPLLLHPVAHFQKSLNHRGTKLIRELLMKNLIEQHLKLVESVVSERYACALIAVQIQHHGRESLRIAIKVERLG